MPSADLEELQAQLLDLIFEVVPAGRGAILLAEGAGQEFNCLYARTRQAGQPQLVRVSRTIARQVMKENVAILGVDVAASGKLARRGEPGRLRGAIAAVRASDGVSAGDRVHLSGQHECGEPVSGRPPATDDGYRRNFRGGAG